MVMVNMRDDQFSGVWDIMQIKVQMNCILSVSLFYYSKTTATTWGAMDEI
jgi:hypothetical protein